MTSHRPRPRKSLGQHFLIDPNIVRKIMRLAALQPNETVLEIGPGRGILTRALCAEAQTVIAVELDQKLSDDLAEELAGSHNLDLRRGDGLAFPYDTLPLGTVVVANLPYYVSTPLLFKLFDARVRIDRMILMLQTEVARRLVAKPGTRDYGILSVLTQYWVEASLAFRVSASCFRPSPNVGSSVVKLVTRTQPVAHTVHEASFVRVVRAAFAHRRKTLANSLRDEGFQSEPIALALARVGIESSQRAERLSIEEFLALAEVLAMPEVGD